MTPVVTPAALAVVGGGTVGSGVDVTGGGWRWPGDTALRLLVPGEPPLRSGAVWFRDGRCVDVLAEVLELCEQRR